MLQTHTELKQIGKSRVVYVELLNVTFTGEFGKHGNGLEDIIRIHL